MKGLHFLVATVPAVAIAFFGACRPAYASSLTIDGTFIQPNVSVSQLRVLFRLTGTRGAKQSSHVIDSRASSTRAVPADALVKPDSHSLRIAVHLELLPGDCSLFRTFRTLARGVPGLCRVIHDH